MARTRQNPISAQSERAAKAREETLVQLLRDWADLARAQQKILREMGREVIKTSQFVETHTERICGHVHVLAKALKGEGGTAIKLAEKMSSLVSDLQFQDRAAQRLNFVAETLSLIAEALSEADTASAPVLDNAVRAGPDQFFDLAARLGRETLAQLQARMNERLKDAGPASSFGPSLPDQGSPAEGDIELF